MVLITFMYEKTADDGTISRVPAVLFSNSSVTRADLRVKYPAMDYVTAYSIDANPYELPLDVMLYDSNELLNLLNINEQLEREIKELKQEVISGKGKELSPSIEEIEPVVEVIQNNEDQRTKEMKKFQKS